MPLELLSDPKLPKRVLSGIIAALLVVVGAVGAEVRASRVGHDAEVNEIVRVKVPNLENRVLKLELEMAAVQGAAQRIEGKVDAGNAQIASVAIAVARVETVLKQFQISNAR